MSQIVCCPNCGGKAKIKKTNHGQIYQAIQEEEAFTKIGQLKKLLDKFQAKVASLENELEAFKISK